MTKCAVFGKTLGEYDDWDGDDLEIIFYDFVPADGVPLPSGDLCVSYSKGSFDYYDEAGEVVESFDALLILNNIKE